MVDNDSDVDFYLYDANGNVGQLINVADGTIDATYEYDPFGRLVKSTGSKANQNPYRFSTKPLDAETGLYYYGYRYLDVDLGRWVRRDPTGERSSMNLYGFLGNNSVTSIDCFGLFDIVKKLFPDAMDYEVIGGHGPIEGFLYDIGIWDGKRKCDIEWREKRLIEAERNVKIAIQRYLDSVKYVESLQKDYNSTTNAIAHIEDILANRQLSESQLVVLTEALSGHKQHLGEMDYSHKIWWYTSTDGRGSIKGTKNTLKWRLEEFYNRIKDYNECVSECKEGYYCSFVSAAIGGASSTIAAAAWATTVVSAPAAATGAGAAAPISALTVAEIFTLISIGNDAYALMVCGKGWKETVIDVASLKINALGVYGASLNWESFAEGLAFHDFEPTYASVLY